MEQTKKLYVARDKNGHLFLYSLVKPYRCENNWWRNYEDKGRLEFDHSTQIDDSLFPELKWEDEPIEVFLNTGYDMANQINHVWAMLKTTQDELVKTKQQNIFLQTQLDNIEAIIKKGKI